MYDATLKIVLLGDEGVGKKTFSRRSLTNLFTTDSAMTVGVDFEVKSLQIDGKKVKIQVNRFSGEERFKHFLPSYVRGAKGGIIMYDITNYSSFAHIDDWLAIIRKESKTGNEFPIIVVGNKADLESERKVSSQEGIDVAKSRNLDGFIECSSKTGENVEEIFEALTRLMLAHEAEKLGKGMYLEERGGKELIEKKTRDALIDRDNELRQRKGYKRAYFEDALLLLKSGEYEEAIEEYEKSVNQLINIRQFNLAGISLAVIALILLKQDRSTLIEPLLRRISDTYPIAARLLSETFAVTLIRHIMDTHGKSGENEEFIDSISLMENLPLFEEEFNLLYEYMKGFRKKAL